MKGFLFFEGRSPNAPEILIECIYRLSLYTDSSVVVTNSEYIHQLSQKFENIVFLDNLLFEPSKSETLYKECVGNKYIRSNHPETEILCLRRWEVLSKLYIQGYLSCKEPVLCLDWDTLLFEPIHKLNKRILDKYTNNNPFVVAFYKNGLRGSSAEGKLPLFETCPNLIYMNEQSIRLYVSIVLKILSNRKLLTSIFANRFYNDMSVFSVLISHIFRYDQYGSVFDLDDLSDEVEIFSDHNIRVPNQGKHSFVTHAYSIPPQIDYTGDGVLRVKKLIFKEAIPYVITKSGKQLSCACLHFSGVEAKYLLESEVTPFKLLSYEF